MSKSSVKRYTHAPISEIEVGIAGGEITHAEAHALLSERAKRDSRSGRNAQAWVTTHPLAEKASKRTRKAQAPVEAPVVKTLTPEEEVLAWLKVKGTGAFQAGKAAGGVKAGYAAQAKFYRDLRTLATAS